jgi:signal transduction histidine kinase
MSPMESDSAAVRLGTVVDASRDDIERRWLASVRRDLTHARPVELMRLRDGLAHYLSGLVVLLTGSHVLRQQGARDVWLEVARSRGVTRARAGFDIEQLVHELVVLGRVIRDVAIERGVLTAGPEAVLADLLDAAIGAAVRAYVDARDREARVRQDRHADFLTHELRNPLGTAMLTAARLRQERTAGDTDALDRLDRCHDRLSSLIDRLLLTQKLEAAKPESRPTPTSLGQVMSGLLERASGAAAAKGLAFQVSYDPLVELRVDSLLTRVAIQRLVEDAVADTETGWVEVAVEERRDTLVIHLRDTCGAIARGQLAIAKRAIPGPCG